MSLALQKIKEPNRDFSKLLDFGIDIEIMSQPMSISTLSSETIYKIKAFWTWFQSYEDKLRAMEYDSQGFTLEKHLGRTIQLIEHFGKIDNDLSIEMLRTEDDSIMELQISANGIVDLFHLVEGVCDLAPVHPNWLITKYRQRTLRFNKLTLKDVTLDPSDVRVGINKDLNTGMFALTVFLNGYQEEQAKLFHHLGFLILDRALGEIDIATKVSKILFTDFTHESFDQSYSLAQLAIEFDSRYKTYCN